MSETIVVKKFKVKDAYKVFTDELKIDSNMAVSLVHRDYWALIDRMREVATGELEPPKFINDDALEEFETRCVDVCYGYICEFDAYSGWMSVDFEDGADVEFGLGEVLNPDLLVNPGDMDEWAPWCRRDLKAIARIVDERMQPKVDWVEVEINDCASDSEIILRYCPKTKHK